MSAVDIDYLRGWIGREQVREQLLAPFPAQALSATLNRNQAPNLGDALPATWQWLYFNDQALQQELGADGHARTGSFLPPVPLPRRMWAAGAFSYLHPLRLGSLATRVSKVASVELKQGSTGPLVFVTVEHQVHQDSNVCLSEQQHLVYRDMPLGSGASPTSEPAFLVADQQQVFQSDPVLLFRYSALTFNAHRIHYDRDYATGAEHYPALVVHGPLLATLLAEQVALLHPAESISHFTFRALRPVFDNDRLRLCSKREGERVQLWVLNPHGDVTMTAMASMEAGL
ncbi:FAS1-like dehydratase domain-containing protein [Pseudomonas yamanorum]|uniref:FAS1-like dehydratase domain-containing protein n=1 Tax=Pseudomonas yamanorum TaxID=515393 RepID=UPI003F7517C8